MWMGFDWSEVGKLAAWVVATAGASFAGSYFAAYLKKKGENLATHEDIDKVVDQVKAVTQTTKEIEAKISGELWDRQKQWELKREVTFGAAKAAGAAKDTLVKMHGIYMTDKRNLQQGKPIREDKQTEAYAAFNKAADELDQAFLLVATVCGDGLRNEVGGFAVFARGVAIEIAEGKPEKFLEKTDEFGARYTNIAKAIRAELGLTDKK